MAGRYSESLIDEVLHSNDIIDIISEYVNLKRTGRNYKGLCPFHTEKTPSFMVSQDKQLYHCFGCGAAGNVINFIMNIENLDFIDALEFLAEKAGINIEQYKENNGNQEIYIKKQKLYEINRQAAIFFYKNLTKNDNEGIRYLKKRGLNIETIKKFGLGYAINDWEALNKYLLAKGYSQKLIYEAGLVIKREKSSGYYDRFRNRVIFPIISTTKKILGFGGRVLDDSIPKYLNSPESLIFNKRNILYGLNLARSELGKERKLILVEGYMDVIALYQYGIKNVIATLGTALTANHGELLKRYCDEVIIAYDSDTAGESATIRGLDVLNEVGCKVKVIKLDRNMDPDEYIRKNGKDSFLEKIKNALPLLDYKIELIKKKYDLSLNEGKIHFLQESIEIIKKLIKSPVEREIYVKKLSKETDVPANVINSEIYGNNKFKKDYKSKKNNYNDVRRLVHLKPVKSVLKDGLVEIEKKIIALCMISKTEYDKIKSHITEEDFSNLLLRNIFSVLGKKYEEDKKIDINLFIDELDIEEAKMLRGIIKNLLPYEDIDKTICELTLSLKRFNIDKKIKSIKNEIKLLEKQENKRKGDVVRINELCGELRRLIEMEKKLMEG
ncbi:DNA primase [Caminicella sporogenes DSM 14501]|uniref:DNA primase n=1 Tax=Caminicella sporogenes DSM 14501 TaxID=1121266 RepID=A0A1M6MAM1_9FIRM|nr:DNA primase [Caminicella sporogenes]RKD27629.1 DNA primase [Caminicella sporogenes]SHJ80477.1 DNA primase [Caminicella sporogenes DSM 14501]